MSKPRGNPKGTKRDELSIAKSRVGQLETGFKRMLARHQEEMLEQQAKIKAAKETLAKLQEEDILHPHVKDYLSKEERDACQEAIDAGDSVKVHKIRQLFNSRVLADGWTVGTDGWEKK